MFMIFFFFFGSTFTFVGRRGNTYLVVFMQNVGPTTKSICITSETSVQVNMSSSLQLESSIKVKIDRDIIISSSKKFVLPSELELESYKREAKAILIEASAAVLITSHANGYATVGSTTHIPLDKLSTKYVVISTEPHGPTNSQLAVASIENNTSISITFKMRRNLPIYIEGKIFQNGDTLHIILNMLETYQITHGTDLTGTLIISSVPIAAFSGNDCNMLEDVGAYDHLIEQLPPTDHVDNTYIVPPNSDFRDTIIRITAVEKSNVTYIIGAEERSLHLNKFDYLDTRISSRQTCFIRSKSPIIVTGFGLASRNSSFGDPSMTIIPGLNQYLDYYKIIVPTGYERNYISFMMRSSSEDSMRINGISTNKTDVVFEEIIMADNVYYSVKLIRVSEGELSVFTTNGERFGLISSGVKIREAYAFSGNAVLL